MADYDAIVVGAGLAGSAAAYRMAKAGLSVLLLERGDRAGAKNMTGGRLYAHSLERLVPDFAASAPVERKVVRESVGLMTADSCVTAQFRSPCLGAVPASSSWTVLRAAFDPWLAGLAEEAGCDLIAPARVDGLLREGERFIGVRAGEDELTADVTILADGVNSLLAQQAGLKRELSPNQVAVGAKELIELPKGVLEDRFCLNEGEGAACLFAGFPSGGLVGGGFLYTNRESVSLGVVLGLADMGRATCRTPDLLEAFKGHPEIARLLARGKTVEYSGHLVPEAGLAMLPELTAEGLMVAGDAAGFCLNLGYTVRGMDLAVESGALAAETAIEARERGDFSKASLDAYTAKLDESFVMRDLRAHRHAPEFVEKGVNMYGLYPELAESFMLDLFTVNGPSRRLWRRLKPLAARAGFVNPLRDAWRAVKGL